MVLRDEALLSSMFTRVMAKLRAENHCAHNSGVLSCKHSDRLEVIMVTQQRSD